MVGIPGAGFSNNLPPSLAMLALSVLQAGILLSLQGPAKRLLAGRRLWAATVYLARSE